MHDPSQPQVTQGQPASAEPQAAPVYPPQPPQPMYAQPSYPPPYVPSTGSDRSRHGWIWAVAALVLVLGVVGSCVWAVSLLGEGSGGTAGSGGAVAVIAIDGVIAGTGGTGVITPQDFIEHLDEATEDADVKAIVLRVDSPGGTVAASEEISTYVKLCKKPVVVSVGDVAASGAYMVSSQADKIIANPGSAVGSIGVITDIPNVSGLLDKLGVKFTVITAGKYKDAGSPFRSLTSTEVALIQGDVDAVYDQFIGIVAEGRKMERSEVASLATGWAWNGEQAKKLGLVDQIGTYKDALVLAAKLGRIDGKYRVVTYDSKKFEDLLGSLLELRQQLAPVGSLDPRGISRPGPTIAR